AYEGKDTRQLVLDLGIIPVVPPKSNRRHPWDYDHALYNKRNEIEPLCPQAQGFPPYLLTFRKARCPLSGLSQIRTHRLLHPGDPSVGSQSLALLHPQLETESYLVLQS